ncbi:MAG: ABC transporter permease [Caldisphaera sp.]
MIQNKLVNFFKKYKNMIIPYIITIIFFLAGGFITPKYLSITSIIGLLEISVPMGLLAIGETLVILLGGQNLDLSNAAIGSFIIIFAATLKNYPFILVLILVMLFGLAIGTLNALGIIFGKVQPLVMTLAMASIMDSLSYLYVGAHAYGAPSNTLIYISTGRIGMIPIAFIFWIVFALIILYIAHFTVLGRRLYLLGNNQTAGFIWGISRNILTIIAYSLSGMFGALAGLITLGIVVVPYFEVMDSLAIPVIAAVILGGVAFTGGEGSYIGVIGGVLIITALTNLLAMFNISQGLRIFFYGVFLLIVLAIYSRRKALKV